MKTFRYAVGTWAFGALPDRYLSTGYHDKPSLEDQIEAVSKVPGCSGVELSYSPIAVTADNATRIASFAADRGLEIAALAPNVTGDKRWGQGALTNPDRALRREAVDRVRESLDCAASLGVSTVNLWMGQEGFDYPFEADYTSLWSDFVSALAEGAASQPSVTLSVEFKAREPRARNIPSSTAQTLLAVQSAGAPNLRVTLDYGHALLGRENPSQSAALLSAYGKLGHIHMNDNHGDWDWDMVAGATHWWELVEFCHWLDRLDYSGWLSLDVFPFRLNPADACVISIKAIEKAASAAAELKERGLDAILARRDAMEVYRMLLETR